MNRRSFFRSLALLGAAATGAPGIFIPKFKPVHWKVTPTILSLQTRSFVFRPEDYYGEWRFIEGVGPPVEVVYAIKPAGVGLVECVFHKREESPP